MASGIACGSGVPESGRSDRRVSDEAIEALALAATEHLAGRRSFDRQLFADTVMLALPEEAGGFIEARAAGDLEDPARWQVARVRFGRPHPEGRITVSAGRHFNCMEMDVGQRFPSFAESLHAGVLVVPPGAGSCLVAWNTTFVFSADGGRITHVLYDQWEW